MPTQYRQGDILLVRLRARPPALAAGRRVPRVNGRRGLALGEAPGHAHAIESPLAELVEHGDGRLYLWARRACELAHEEHAPMWLEAGVYQVIRQREYVPGAERRVVRD
jgi:hypothetical protein